MARSQVNYTYGRESRQQYNESGAGSQQHTGTGYGIEFMSPFDDKGQILPLLRPDIPLAPGQADRAIQVSGLSDASSGGQL